MTQIGSPASQIRDPSSLSRSNRSPELSLKPDTFCSRLVPSRLIIEPIHKENLRLQHHQAAEKRSNLITKYINDRVSIYDVIVIRFLLSQVYKYVGHRRVWSLCSFLCGRDLTRLRYVKSPSWVHLCECVSWVTSTTGDQIECILLHRHKGLMLTVRSESKYSAQFIPKKPQQRNLFDHLELFFECSLIIFAFQDYDTSNDHI